MLADKEGVFLLVAIEDLLHNLLFLLGSQHSLVLVRLKNLQKILIYYRDVGIETVLSYYP